MILRIFTWKLLREVLINFNPSIIKETVGNELNVIIVG